VRDFLNEGGKLYLGGQHAGRHGGGNAGRGRQPAPDQGRGRPADLCAYAGKKIEVSISVTTDWGTLGLGVWVDDAKVTLDGAQSSFADFESDTGGWQLGPSPEGSANPVVGWERVTEEFQEGAVVATDDTVYSGFGFEGIRGAEKRKELMRGVLTHLGIL
jgi:hypothetical protein